MYACIREIGADFWSERGHSHVRGSPRVCLTNTKRGHVDPRESRFSVVACGQVAALGRSGALEMIVDRIEQTLAQKEPSSTSPSLL